MRYELYKTIFYRLEEVEIILSNQQIVAGTIIKVTDSSVWVFDNKLESIVVVEYNNICEIENLAA